MAGRIANVGYEGRTVEELVERLATDSIDVLVDVRLNPISRKPGFSRRRLSDALADASIEYVHERALGNPPDNRAAFHHGDGRRGRTRMREIVAEPDGAAALDRVVGLARHRRIALLCVERDRHRCHRDVIIAMAVERDPSLEIVDLH